MFQLDVKKAMRMGETHAFYVNSSLSTAHHPTLGFLTMDSIAKAGSPDTSSIADNPPVAGAAGASDPNVAGAVRGIRDRALPLGSPDRTTKDSGQVDQQKLDASVPGAQFLSGFAARISKNKAR
jgi:hypothetical protein